MDDGRELMERFIYKSFSRVKRTNKGLKEPKPGKSSELLSSLGLQRAEEGVVFKTTCKAVVVEKSDLMGAANRKITQPTSVAFHKLIMHPVV